jgi:hypothetical protein
MEKIMIKRIASVTLVTLLIVTICKTSAYAGTSAGDEVKPAENTSTGDNKHVNEKLRIDILKLVADAKAGKVAPAPRPQIQPRQSNSLSKGTKIAIAVGVVVAVVAIIVIAKTDAGPSGPIGIF